MKAEHEVKRIDGICMNLKNILDVVFRLTLRFSF